MVLSSPVSDITLRIITDSGFLSLKAAMAASSSVADSAITQYSRMSAPL